jgi:hypothetical protein
MYILTSVHDTELKMLSNLYPYTDKNHFLYFRLEAVSNHQFIASGFVLNISKHITFNTFKSNSHPNNSVPIPNNT